MALLYNTKVPNISKHIKNINVHFPNSPIIFYSEESVQLEGNRKINRKINYYNQDIIYKVSEKVKSLRNVKFKEWVDSLFTTQVDLLPVNNGQNYELIEFKDGDFSDALNVSPNENTVWLTQEQIALLFDTTKQNISLHINNILSDGELDSNSVVKFFFTTASDGKRYNIMY